MYLNSYKSQSFDLFCEIDCQKTSFLILSCGVGGCCPVMVTQYDCDLVSACKNSIWAERCSHYSIPPMMTRFLCVKEDRSSDVF